VWRLDCALFDVVEIVSPDTNDRGRAADRWRQLEIGQGVSGTGIRGQSGLQRRLVPPRRANEVGDIDRRHPKVGLDGSFQERDVDELTVPRFREQGRSAVDIS
jgi:hypothetical protein